MKHGSNDLTCQNPMLELKSAMTRQGKGPSEDRLLQRAGGRGRRGRTRDGRR